jgi:hypothetical protein
MSIKQLVIRFAGIPVAILGVAMIVGSGELLSTKVLLELSEGIDGLMLRGGFAVMLLGLLTTFLFSMRSIPREISSSFMETQARNTGRLLESLEIKGNGIYMPPRGRLTDDRVYVPLESKDFPIPNISDLTVFNTGTSTPSMGISLVPPGKGLVDRVEKMTGTRFEDTPIMDGSESLEKLSKGTGLFRSLEMRDRKDTIEIRIFHDRNESVCHNVWEEFRELHSQVGCPLCSSVLCAAARISGVPLRIVKVNRDDNIVRYELRKVTE